MLSLYVELVFLSEDFQLVLAVKAALSYLVLSIKVYLLGVILLKVIVEVRNDIKYRSVELELSVQLEFAILFQELNQRSSITLSLVGLELTISVEEVLDSKL